MAPPYSGATDMHDPRLHATRFPTLLVRICVDVRLRTVTTSCDRSLMLRFDIATRPPTAAVRVHLERALQTEQDEVGNQHVEHRFALE